jgi:hypothetical protein
MTSSSRIVIEQFAFNLIEGIKNNIRNKQVTPYGSMHTTGKAEDSLFYKLTDNGLIIGSTWAYIRVLEDGRKPGEFAPPEIVQKWVDDKPLGTDMPRKSLAYLINRKISEEGSLLYRQGGNSGVLSDYLNKEYVHNNLTKPLGKALIDEVTGILFKRAA